MRKNTNTISLSGKTLAKVTLLSLESRLRKKQGFWIGFLIGLAIIWVMTDFHATTPSLIYLFVFAPLFSFSVGYGFLSLRRLILCVRFLKPTIKNKPASLLKQPLVLEALTITRRCLYRFCLSVTLIFSMILAFIFLTHLSDSFFYPLICWVIISAVIYGFSLLFTHGQLMAVLGHPILNYLRTCRFANTANSSVHTTFFTDINAQNLEAIQEKEDYDALRKRLWEDPMQDPFNPASPQYQTNTLNQHTWDDDSRRWMGNSESLHQRWEK